MSAAPTHPMPSTPIDILLVSEEETPSENYISGFMRYCLVTQTLALRNGETGWPNLHPPHLAVAVLAAYLRKNGYNPAFMDNIFRTPENREKMRAVIRSGTPALGISTSLLFNAASVRGIIDEARAINPGIMVILGGASARRSEIMELGDVAILGPGEKTLLDLLNAVKRGRSPAAVPGVYYRDNGLMRHTCPAATSPLDLIPPPDWGAALTRSSLCYPIEASRGCDHNCAFCSYPGHGCLELKDPALVADELARNAALGIRTHRFMDSDLAARPEHAERICSLITERGLNVQWSCYARADSLAGRPGLADKMRAAGCAAVFLGAESGDDGILASMNKGCDARAIELGIAAAKHAGILAHANFIIGFPGETGTTVDNTLELIRRAEPDTAAFFLFCLHNGSSAPVWRNKVKWGLSGGGVDWSHRTMDSAAAEAHIERAMRAVLEEMPRTLIGNEYWITLMTGYGLTPPQCLKFMRDVRDHHRALAGNDHGPAAKSAGDILAAMREMNSRAKSFSAEPAAALSDRSSGTV